jgi:hypothetical protein
LCGDATIHTNRCIASLAIPDLLAPVHLVHQAAILRAARLSFIFKAV